MDLINNPTSVNKDFNQNNNVTAIIRPFHFMVTIGHGIFGKLWNFNKGLFKTLKIREFYIFCGNYRLIGLKQFVFFVSESRRYIVQLFIEVMEIVLFDQRKSWKSLCGKFYV